MNKTFEQFHFSLLLRDQPDLLEPSRDRASWLRFRFSERFTFLHHGNQFWWVPQKISDEYLVGVIERQKFQIERTPPTEGAEEVEGSFWTGAMVIIDPRDLPGGQAVAVENNARVGQPNAILTSLVAHINGIPANQYSLLFKALFKGGSFWRFAAKHGGQLEYVRFRFTVPNMIFGAGGGVKKGLRRIGEDTDAQEIEIKIESEEGIRADSEAVREGVEYGEEGNATVTAKALNGDRWSSTRQRLTVLGVIVTITLASAASLHLELNRLEDEHKETFDEARSATKSYAYMLIWLFLAAIALVIVKPILALSPFSQAIFNSIAILIIILNVMALMDLTGAVFQIPARRRIRP